MQKRIGSRNSQNTNLSAPNRFLIKGNWNHLICNYEQVVTNAKTTCLEKKLEFNQLKQKNSPNAKMISKKEGESRKSFAHCLTTCVHGFHERAYSHNTFFYLCCSSVFTVHMHFVYLVLIFFLLYAWAIVGTRVVSFRIFKTLCEFDLAHTLIHTQLLLYLSFVSNVVNSVRCTL